LPLPPTGEAMGRLPCPEPLLAIASGGGRRITIVRKEKIKGKNY